jgi:hypothetical protein
VRTAHRVLADRGTGRPLTRQDLADRDRDRVLGLLGLLGRVLVDRVMGRGLAGRVLVDRVMGRGLAGRDLAGRDLAGRDLAGRDLAGRDLADRDLAGRDLADRDLADRGKGRDLADRGKGRDRADRDLGRGVADRCRRALTTGVMRRWVAPRMRLAASAHATTARRLRRQGEGSAGMMGLLPVGRRLTGTVRRLRVAGTVLRPPVVGTTGGMGPTAA